MITLLTLLFIITVIGWYKAFKLKNKWNILQLSFHWYLILCIGTVTFCLITVDLIIHYLP